MTMMTMLDMDRNPPGRHRRNQAAGLSTHERFSTGEHNAEQRSPFSSLIIIVVIIIIINKINNNNLIKKEKDNHLKGTSELSGWETLESCIEIFTAMKILKCQWAPIKVLFSFECSAVCTYQVIKLFERGDPVLLSLIAHSPPAAAVKRREHFLQKNSPIGWHRRFWTKCRRNRFLLLWFRNFSGVQPIYLIHSSVLKGCERIIWKTGKWHRRHQRTEKQRGRRTFFPTRAMGKQEPNPINMEPHPNPTQPHI